MLLNARHDRRAIQKPPKLKSIPSTPQEALAELRALRPPDGASEPRQNLLRDPSAGFAIEAFARRHMQVRDALAWRAALGEALSEVERATLATLDAVLDALEPPSEPLSREAQDILRDVLRR